MRTQSGEFLNKTLPRGSEEADITSRAMSAIIEDVAARSANDELFCSFFEQYVASVKQRAPSRLHQRRRLFHCPRFRLGMVNCSDTANVYGRMVHQNGQGEVRHARFGAFREWEKLLYGRRIVEIDTRWRASPRI